MSQNQYKKILLLKHGSLGDITFALPAMYSIRSYFKKSKITLLTESKFINFLKKSKYFDNYLLDNRKGIIGSVFIIIKILYNKYDLIVDLQNSKRSNIYNFIFKILSKAKINGSRSNAHFRYIIPKQGVESPTEGLFKQLSLINIPKIKPSYNWLIADIDIANKKNLILFIPGVSKSGLYKQWNPIMFAKLAKYFEDQGYLICVIGTENDYKSVKPTLELCKKVVNKISKSPPEVIYTIAKNSNLIISNDTGPGHLASLSNTNILWIGLDNMISRSNLNFNNSFSILKKNISNITVDEVIRYVKDQMLLNK